ncbi:RagB/SusD family nutrient uptake outer membrane protein [Longitalea arenae]|uniref:RagB/SusD family nutrient uptake outer membrane protein n=1 Tax=Longitalea arenae TaxID=2812558 RepID=UPI0019688A52|nr:RagB/SusD family nutrient uptake outer membrane protein [Longitalea arenae]
MKLHINKLLIFVAFVLALATASCKKILDPDPKDVIPADEFPKDFWDAEFMLRGAYQALQPIVEYRFILGEMRADWVKPGPGADKDLLELANHSVTPGNRFTNWKVFYDLINRANYVIENVPRVPADANNFSQFEKNQYVGEARFLRSWAYFNLVMNFDSVPLVLTATDNISKVPYLSATPQEVILDTIEADLINALATTDIMVSVPNSFEVGKRVSEEQSRLRVTKKTVCALQAEVYLWRGKYAQAAAACSTYETVNGAGPGNRGDWFSMYLGVSNQNLFGEPMFFVAFNFLGREISPLMKYTSNDPASGGLYMVAPSDSAIKTYNPNYPNSVSTNNAIDEIDRGFGRSYAGSAPYYNRLKSSPVIWKYLGLGTVTPSTIDVPPNVRAPYQSEAKYHIYRFADVYLLWAEALNRLGDKTNAIARINAVRDRARMPAPAVTVNSTTEQIEDYILRERGLELGFEGRRWYDLMRFARRGRPELLVNAVKKRAPLPLHAHIESTLINPKNWYLPYNAEEKRLNPNL